jgi:sphingolipid 4-desaturase/C4-monooxygenase
MGAMTVSSEHNPHPARARAILAMHPHVRALFGRSGRAAVVGVLVTLAHFAIAVLLAKSDAPVFVAGLVAWLVGAFLAHASFVVMHEACHRLVFRRRTHNRLLMLFVNLPLLAPFAIPFGHYHLLHHRALGEHARDPDLPAEWEVERFERSRLHRFVWQLLFPFLSAIRAAGDAKDRLRIGDPWLVANVVVQVAITVMTARFLGVTALVYLATSTYFVFALHPLFGRFLQEHFVVAEEQETNSYYGALNRVSLNFGFHTEHHDFASIPWHRLPALRAAAPEFYASRAHHRSWARLWLAFTFGRGPWLDRRLRRLQSLSTTGRNGARRTWSSNTSARA